MQSIFNVNQFQFPYKYKFPGQSSKEQILYLTRENRFLLFLRRLMVVIAALALFLTGIAVQFIAQQLLGDIVGGLFRLIVIGLPLVFLVLGWWWVTNN